MTMQERNVTFAAQLRLRLVGVGEIMPFFKKKCMNSGRNKAVQVEVDRILIEISKLG